MGTTKPNRGDRDDRARDRGPLRPDPGVLLELFGELDEAAAGSPRAFFDRICQGVCELTEMTRCALLLYDEREKRVLPAGSHGIEEAIVEQLHGTLDETPIAVRALSEDRVVVTSERTDAIPRRHRGLPGVETIACVPVLAGERWLGLMLCDRGGGSFELDDPNRPDSMSALGRTAALAASTRLAFGQHERAKMLSERIALAREVHDRVIQRLFGLSLALGSGRQLTVGEQERAAEELRSALEDLALLDAGRLSRSTVTSAATSARSTSARTWSRRGRWRPPPRAASTASPNSLRTGTAAPRSAGTPAIPVPSPTPPAS